jgi:biotin-dependent carboxylase-like uncharacterized protein
LTTGGPLDTEAFSWANRLLNNTPGVCAIEASFGGLDFEMQVATRLCITGAENTLTINGEERALWRTWNVESGDRIKLGYSSRGCRNYVAVAGGFAIPEVYGSCATVVREAVGGLSGDKLRSGDELPCASVSSANDVMLPESSRPRYESSIDVRVVPGYQQQDFPATERRKFFSAEFVVSDRCDRMGYRLEGPFIKCNTSAMLSEGICHGAIQIPADGQPIVLLNDRQTIGGYPKIGSVMSLDTAKLAQLTPGGRVNFVPVSNYQAHNDLHLARARYQRTAPVGVE